VQTVKEILEARDAKVAELTELGTELEGREDITDEDTARVESLTAEIDELEELGVKADAKERRSVAIEAARSRIMVPVGDGVVRSEPRQYGEGSENSYFADVGRASSMLWHGHDDAVRRLQSYSHELAVEAKDGSSEGKRARKAVGEANRSENGMQARQAMADLEQRAGMDTTAASGGSFVTPEYFVQNYAAYRQFGRVFADAANKQDLPPYGMTIFIPAVSGPAGVSAQVGQNQGITEVDPTAGYLSTNLTTNAGQVIISQQLLDRAGPNFSFDVMVFDQLTRAYNLTLDAYVLAQALASAGSVSCTTTALTGTGSQFSKVGQAKAAIADTAGTVLPATHAFYHPTNWEWAAAQVDTTGRPLVVPAYASPYNAAYAGSDGTPQFEGPNGYKVGGLPVYEDANIPASGGNNQIVVAHMPEVWFWEGDLVPRVIPQTYAQNLSVLLQVYAYVGAIVRYPNAVQRINGSGIPTSPTF